MTKFRKWLAPKLAKLAFRIDPECPEAMAFFHKQMIDYMMYGGNITRIDYKNFKPDEGDDEATKNEAMGR